MWNPHHDTNEVFHKTEAQSRREQIRGLQGGRGGRDARGQEFGSLSTDAKEKQRQRLEEIENSFSIFARQKGNIAG